MSLPLDQWSLYFNETRLTFIWVNQYKNLYVLFIFYYLFYYYLLFVESSSNYYSLTKVTLPLFTLCRILFNYLVIDRNYFNIIYFCRTTLSSYLVINRDYFTLHSVDYSSSYLIFNRCYFIAIYFLKPFFQLSDYRKRLYFVSIYFSFYKFIFISFFTSKSAYCIYI